MGIRLKLPSTLHRLTDGTRAVEIEAAQVDELLGKLCDAFPKLRAGFFKTPGELNRNVQVFVNSQQIQLLQNLQTPVTAKDDVTLIVGLSSG